MAAGSLFVRRSDVPFFFGVGTNLYEAVEKAVEARPDLILMDIALPVLDVIGATEAIRSHAELADIPIVALSAYGDFYRDKALAVGCNEVVQKPLVRQYV